MRSALVAVLLCTGCHARTLRDPVADARVVLRSAAHALASHDDQRLDAEVASPGRRDSDVEPEDAEQKTAVARLEAAARGNARVFARARTRGPLGVEVVLERERDGWRVDPESIGVVLATPAAAIEQLIAALERLPSDPALALLSYPLRSSILSAASVRSHGLRELVLHLPAQINGRLPLQLEYGQGFFVVLRAEDGGWRIDDFN